MIKQFLKYIKYPKILKSKTKWTFIHSIAKNQIEQYTFNRLLESCKWRKKIIISGSLGQSALSHELLSVDNELI